MVANEGNVTTLQIYVGKVNDNHTPLHHTTHITLYYTGLLLLKCQTGRQVVDGAWCDLC